MISCLSETWWGGGAGATAGTGTAFVYIEVQLPRGRNLCAHVHLEAAGKP